MSDKTPTNRLIVVSNRLPVIVHRNTDGGWYAERGGGGLVSALLPVLRNRGGLWVGWPGSMVDDPAALQQAVTEMTANEGYTFQPVLLSQAEVDGFYLGFSNEILWPLFHDLPDKCHFEPSFWHSYRQVNRKYATEVASVCTDEDFIWVHDYHLMMLADELRACNVHCKIGFFLHIPFPPLDIYLKLPWRFEILHHLLAFDLIGFQTLRDRRNFLDCVRTLFRGSKTQGSGSVIRLQVSDPTLTTTADREIRVGSFPISIDYQGMATAAKRTEVKQHAAYLREQLNGCQMVLGVDRLDYSKGLPHRLKAFRAALRRFPDLHGNIVLSQHMMASRADIPEYKSLLGEIERLVGEINGEFTQPDWVPIQYFYHSLPREELIAYFRTADAMLISSLKDGMNLVAKEYCAAQLDENGVLLLSEFAGAAAQMQNAALLFNPFDVEGSGERIYQAFKMPSTERRKHMRKLRRGIRDYDIFRWVDAFLSAAIDKDLSHFPIINDYIPRDPLSNPEPLPDALERHAELMQRLQGKRLVVFLDYDGTLTEIVADPDQALLDETTRATIRQLAEHYPVAIVSGRGLDDVYGKVAIDSIYFAGDHGFAIRGPSGSDISHEPGAEFADGIAQAQQEAAEAIAQIPGAWVERKRYSGTVHYRQVAQERIAEVENAVNEVIARHGNLRKHHGKKVFEIRPAIDWDKGKAVLWLLDTLHLAGPDALPLYIGDDVTDEDAFRALEGRGIGIRVSEENQASAAAYRLPDIAAVQRFLALLAET